MQLKNGRKDVKGKKLITWMISAVLMAGSVTPVYGAGADLVTENAAETLEGNALIAEDLTETVLSDESVAETAREKNSVTEDSKDDSTEAVPENVQDAAGESTSGNKTAESADESGADSSSKSKTADLTESKTDSLTDSSVAALNKEQETVVGATYTSAVPQDGKVYYIRPASNRNFAITVSGSSVNNGANIVLGKLTKTYNQKFMCRKLTDGTFSFTAFNSGKSLRVEGNAAKNKANVWQYEFASAKSARWKAIKNSDGSYRLATSMNANYVLDIPGSSMTENNNIQLYKWNNSVAQKFTFTETPIPSYEGTVQLRPSNGHTMCAAPAGNSTAAGAAIHLTDANDAKNLTYTAVRQWGGYYVLVNRSNGLALTVQNSSKTAGAKIVQQKRDNTFAQQWLIIKNSNGTYSYISRLNNALAIAAQSGKTSSGTAMILATFKNYTSQKYYTSIYVPPSIPTTTVYIRSCVNSDRVLDVSAAGTADGTNIDCYDWNASNAQKFKLEAVVCGNTTDYWYKITGTASGKVLTVAGSSATAGANIQLGTYARTKAQLWHPALLSDGTYVLKSALNQKLVLEMTGSEAYGVNVRLGNYTPDAKQKWYFTSVTITKNTIAYSDNNTVTVRASGSKQLSDTGKAYLFAISPYGKTIKGYQPLASADMSTSFIFHAKLNKNSAGSLLHRKFYIATLDHGKYRIISNGFYIQNPEVAATNTKAFPTPARGTKKGLKTSADSQSLAKNLHCSHVVLDLPIDGFLNGSDLAYKYEGQTYHFSSIIDVYGDRIKSYNDLGIVVTGIFYLYDSSNTAYMYPAAASGSRRYSATLYALNTRNANRKRLEALFACLAERWSTNGITLANWIYGNELQQYNVYHYAGDISYSEYHEALAEGFRMFNASIKSRWRNARTYISLDHNWNLSWNVAGTYNGMALTSDFNNDLKRQGLVHWDMAMHPYPSPEQDCRIWNRVFTVEDSGAAQQITPLNSRFFSAYIKNTYGSNTRVIMSETGLSSVYNGTQMQGQQAAAVAFAYYLAEFDPNIDMFAIHRDYDNSGETSAGWYLGIYHANRSAKPSADVFKYMDTKNWNSHVSHYMNSYLGSDWKSKIHGFNASFFTNK